MGKLALGSNKLFKGATSKPVLKKKKVGGFGWLGFLPFFTMLLLYTLFVMRNLRLKDIKLSSTSKCFNLLRVE